jgi:hypothetical protein
MDSLRAGACWDVAKPLLAGTPIGALVMIPDKDGSLKPLHAHQWNLKRCAVGFSIVKGGMEHGPYDPEVTTLLDQAFEKHHLAKGYELMATGRYRPAGSSIDGTSSSCNSYCSLLKEAARGGPPLLWFAKKKSKRGGAGAGGGAKKKSKSTSPPDLDTSRFDDVFGIHGAPPAAAMPIAGAAAMPIASAAAMPIASAALAAALDNAALDNALLAGVNLEELDEMDFDDIF